MGDQILHFGKHKGEHLSDIPLSYLEWVILNVGDKKAVAGCIAELDRRGDRLPKGVKRPDPVDWKGQMAQTHYLWQGWHGNTEWIPHGVDMTNREFEECPFEVEPWDVHE
jgi:hypothetical protein